jgi:hypothetical protein
LLRVSLPASAFSIPHQRSNLFADRNAGMMILFSLVESGAPGDTVPPRQPVKLSLSSASRRFGVSRAHVRNPVARRR